MKDIICKDGEFAAVYEGCAKQLRCDECDVYRAVNSVPVVDLRFPGQIVVVCSENGIPFYTNHDKYLEDGPCEDGEKEKMDVYSIPPANLREVKKARWNGVSPFVDSLECSGCRYCILGEEMKTPYCPWCGAEMENWDE